MAGVAGFSRRDGCFSRAVGGLGDGVGGLSDGVGGLGDGVGAPGDGVGGLGDGVGGPGDGVGAPGDGVGGHFHARDLFFGEKCAINDTLFAGATRFRVRDSSQRMSRNDAHDKPLRKGCPGMTLMTGPFAKAATK